MDDIQILRWASPGGDPDTPILDCDFEHDTCTWWNVDNHVLPMQEDNIDWVRRTARGGGTSLNGPPADNTLETDLGYYLLMEATGKPDAAAVLASQPLDANVTYCLTWYTYGPKNLGAEIKIHYHDLVSSETGDLCNAWTCIWDGDGDHWDKVTKL